MREKIDAFFAGLAKCAAEVIQRCRRDLQAQADALANATSQVFRQTKHVDPILESV
jgi:hypothetical protein